MYTHQRNTMYLGLTFCQTTVSRRCVRLSCAAGILPSSLSTGIAQLPRSQRLSRTRSRSALSGVLSSSGGIPEWSRRILISYYHRLATRRRIDVPVGGIQTFKGGWGGPIGSWFLLILISLVGRGDALATGFHPRNVYWGHSQVQLSYLASALTRSVSIAEAV